MTWLLALFVLSLIATTLIAFWPKSRPAFGLAPALEAGAIIINEDGEENTYYLPGATVVDGGKTVKYLPPKRFYLMRENVQGYTSDASKFYKPLLVGKTFSVDIEYSRDGEEPAGCGCNLNFYMVDMPAASPGKDGDYYCDAQCFPDMGCCAEWDMNEMNARVVQVTNHACKGPYSQDPSWKCQKWGDPEVKSSASDFGIGPGHTIDTRNKFTFAQSYRLNGGQLSVVTTMTQEGRQLVLNMAGNDQLQAMMTDGSLERGMAFVTGYWTNEDMTWLDGNTGCSAPETCSNSPVYLGNWRITNNGDVPTPTPSPPSPSPSPSSGGHCYWGSCGGHVMDGWCDQSPGNCAGCGGGHWC